MSTTSVHRRALGRRFMFLVAALGAFNSLAPAQPCSGGPPAGAEPGTVLLTNPAISDSHLAFVYDGDLWVANADGTDARRLTTHEGTEANPVFSPDGKQIAFSAEYDGNLDVYLVPVAGGEPQRLTWHPGSDVALTFTPDGKSVLFRSARAVFTRRHTQLFTVSTTGGFPEQLPIPHAHKACYSPDGQSLAYTPLSERFQQWKNYRGGTVSRIWLYATASHAVTEIPQVDGRCNDTDPMWIGDRVFFRSDRDGEFNLYAYDTSSRAVTRLTDHDDFPILSVSSGSGLIIYEQAGRLHRFDPAAGSAEVVEVCVAAELLETRPRYVKGAQYIRNGDISPSGARAVFEFRGEIVTVPEKKGDARNLTQSTGVHERSPAWSPDGNSIAYVSDESGEYEMHIRQSGDSNAVKKYQLAGAGFYMNLTWSPDAKRIAYLDNSLSYYWIDLESGVSTKIAQQSLYGPPAMVGSSHRWSHDSKWIAYTLNGKTYMRQVFVYSIDEKKSYSITDGLSDVAEPVFDESGKYLYFLGSTDAGPVRQWFDMSNADMEMTSSIYVAVLRDDLPSPLAPESDEEKGKQPADDDKEKPPAKDEAETNDGGKEKSADPIRIDFDGLDQRIIDLPLPARNYSRMEAGRAGTLYYLEAPAAGGPPELKRFSFKSRRAETIAAGALRYRMTPDRAKVLYTNGAAWTIALTGGAKSSSTLKTDDVEVRIEPRAEWKQIFHEAWRINRDYFYATNFHGADWQAMRRKYETFLPHVATRSDLNRVIQWMCSELAVGHHRVGGGDQLRDGNRVGGGLLGADYEIAKDRYRFQKIYGGLNWNPNLRSPLTAPGVRVAEGEYLLAVDGRELRAHENLYRRFENKDGKQVRLTVGPNADGSDCRTVTAVPVGSENALRNRAWVEGNIRRVDEATGGQVAYVYVPNTAGTGHTYFKRYFFPQAHKAAIIVDERFNGGGQVADYYIDHLRKPLISHWAMRYGDDLKTPSASIQGPKVMIIDETAGSGGDLLPWMFRKFELGPLVGKRTWGGLVGTLGFPVLMDGGSVTAPNLAIWTDDGFVVENAGVPPDVEVEQWPAEVIAGHDPQLEKAIEIIMDELKRNPPPRPERPPFPQRARR